MKPRLNIKNREEHIKKAKNAKKYLIELIKPTNYVIYVNCHNFDL